MTDRIAVQHRPAPDAGAGAAATAGSGTRWNRPLLFLVATSAVLAVLAGIGIFADSRVLTGAPIWLKPAKFGISFAVYAWTLAWLLQVLPRRSRAAEWAAVVIVGMSVAELAVITGQVIRGRTSHYNQATPLDEALWSAMGTAIMVLFLAHIVIAVVALRQRPADRAAAYAIRLGLGLSLLGMAVAFPMTRQDSGVDGVAGAHNVGVPDGGPGMPLTGWSTTGGDLRIGHFVGMHALQALPLLAYVLGRWAGRRLDAVTRARLVLVAGAGYGVLIMVLTWQAMRAQPLLRPDAVTLAVCAALAAATAAATWVVLSRRSPA